MAAEIEMDNDKWREEVRTSAEWCEKELRGVIQFWMKYSLDKKHGGYYNCLSENGEIYDTTKYGWLQGRQVWMLAKLYNKLPEYHTDAILEAAVSGGKFLLQYFKLPGEQRCYFSVTEDGKPCRLQRKPYTECFYTMGLIELYRATRDNQYKDAAEAMLQQLIHWICVDDSGLGGASLAGVPPTSELGRPMMLLNVVSDFCGTDTTLRDKYRQQLEWSVDAIMKHHDGEWVHEHVLKTGGYPSGCLGRQTTPGHAIEAGWFLLEEAAARGGEELRDQAIDKFIEIPWKYGWDKEYDGFYYFLDTGGYSPVQLEWSMKLWWVHCEALVAGLMAFRATRSTKHWNMFTSILDYTKSHFSDPTHGEWFGYLTREGKVNQTMRGGPYKGCFHVPRCLFLCLTILNDLAAPINKQE